MRRHVIAALLLAMLAVSCGGESESTGEAPTGADDAPTVDGGDADDDTESLAGGEGDDEPAGGVSGASGSVSVDGTTYEFTDVAECEVGGDVGADWREFTAWTEDGHTHVNITLASGDDEWLTGFSLSVGLANARTLDEGNPDEEWTTGLGGSVAPTLTDDGAAGTAAVTTLGVDGSSEATAEWSFSC